MRLEPLPKLLHRMYDKDSLVYQDDNTIYYNTGVDKDLVKDINNRDFQIYNGTYRYEPDYNSPKIYLVGRGRTCGKKKFKIEGALPYCYVKHDEGDYTTYLGERVEKIFFNLSPKKVGEYRRQCEKLGEDQPYEADILFCLKKGTQVSLNNGFKLIEECKPGDVILSCNEETLIHGQSKINGIKKKRVNKYIKITTQLNNIECDEYHKIPVLGRDGIVRVKFAKDILESDFLLTSKFIGKFGKGYRINLKNSNDIMVKLRTPLDTQLVRKINNKFGSCSYNIFRDLHSTRKENMDKICEYFDLDLSDNLEKCKYGSQLEIREGVVDNDFYELYGYYVGDGTRILNNKITITDKDYNNTLYYSHIIKKYTGSRANITEKKDENSYKFETKCKSLANILIEYSLDELSNDTVISDTFIKQCNKTQISHILRGLYDAEGSVLGTSISFTSTSLKLINQVYSLLRRYGIISNIIRKEGGVSHLKNKTIHSSGYSYVIIISETNSIKQFRKYINFNDKKKSELLSNIKADSNRYYYIYPFGDILHEIKQRLKLHHNTWKGYKFSSIYDYTHGHNPSYNKVRELIKGFKLWISDKNIQDEVVNELITRMEDILYRKNIIPIKILKIEEINKETELYDISLDKDYMFYANDLIVHNCRRFLLDTYDFFKSTEYVNPDVCVMDLETDFPYDNNKIISFAINGYDGELYYNSIYDTDNRWELVLDAYEHLLPYDIWTNWNVEFDYKVLSVNILKLLPLLEPAENSMEMNKEDYTRHIYKNNKNYTLKVVSEMMNALLDRGYLYIDDSDYIRRGDKYISGSLDLDVYPLDLLELTKKMIAREMPGRWTLDNIGIQTCGIGKVEYEEKYVRDIPPERLIEYNCMDVIIPEIIDNVYGGIDCHVILAWSLHQMIKDVLITAVVNDIAILREYHKDGIVLPSRPPHSKRDEESYKAAEPDARPGVYRDIISFDLHAAYPSAVLAINASCETKDPNGEYMTPNGIKFNKGYSIFIRTLKGLMKDREEVKSELKILDKDSDEWRTKKFIDFALKTQVAAFSHGIFGWSSSRMKDKAIADAITSTVRGILDCVKDRADEIGYPWVYCHTDSVYLSAPKEEKERLYKLFNDVIKEHCEVMGYAYTPTLDYKGFYPKAYIHSAARNVLIDENGEWEVTGMSYMRSETPKPLSEIEVEMIKMKLDYKTNDEMVEKLIELIYDLKNKDTTELGIIKPLNKPIEKYGKPNKKGKLASIPYHIKALMNAYEDNGYMVNVGEKFCVIPIISGEYEGVRVIKRKRKFMAYDLDEGLPGYFEIDWENYLRSNLWGKICKLFGLTPKQLEKYVCSKMEDL